MQYIFLFLFAVLRVRVYAQNRVYAGAADTASLP